MRCNALLNKSFHIASPGKASRSEQSVLEDMDERLDWIGVSCFHR
jgi:hypothetical protein